ncbi:MAG TPA: hypothetical protein PL143_03160 [Rhodocyclaceae bacterium]|nr:hypothetical protein [Rhodocyclaceae bacterium]
MKIDGKVATWLEMVVAPGWRKTRTVPRLHPILGTGERCCSCPETCYAVSVEGRWLCSNNGRLTVLRGLPAAERFIQLVRLESYETGEPADFHVDCATSAHCIAMGHDQTLRSCRQASTTALA